VGFHITGFGKFEGCSVNPTEKLVCHLLPDSLKCSPLLPEDSDENEIVVLSLTVFETSVEGTRSAFNKIWNSYHRSGATLSTDKHNAHLNATVHNPDGDHLSAHPENFETVDRVIWLHFGVNGSANKILLESAAYNEADFSCPDEKGFVASKCAIDETVDSKNTLFTPINVRHIAQTLSLPPFSFSVTTSTDPGRFLCNYAYYQSLNFSRKFPRHSSLFVHIPPFSKLDEEVQLKFMRNLIQILSRQNHD